MRVVERMNRLGGRLQQDRARSEEHTSELQSQSNLVCRLLLEKKKSRDLNSLDSAESLMMRCCRERLGSRAAQARCEAACGSDAVDGVAGTLTRSDHCGLCPLR